MGTIDSILVEMEQMTKNANICKDIIIDRLLKDGHITPDIASDYISKWQIIVVKKSWFERWMEKFSNDKPNSYVYKLVKFED